jgi:hypothetical protein
MTVTIREVRDQWVEFMATFQGRGAIPRLQGEFDDMLDRHNREVCAGALGRAKVSLPLDSLASVHFIASDGIGSIGMRTNEDSKNQVLKGLDDLAKQYLRGRA